MKKESIEPDDSMKRITAEDHWRVLKWLTFASILWVVLIALLLMAPISGEPEDPSVILIVFGGVGAVYLAPFGILHLQYRWRNRSIGVGYRKRVLRICSGEELIESIILDKSVQLEKVIGSLDRMPHDGCFYYSILRDSDAKPIVLTSLLVGEYVALNGIAEVREKLLPFIDV